MTKREQLVRAGLLLVVLAVVGTLIVLDRGRGHDRPTPAPAPSAAPSEGGTVVPLPSRTPKAGGNGPDVIPTPPPGIEDIACQKLQQSVDIRVVDFNTHRSFGGIGTIVAEISSLDPDIVLLQEIDRFHGRTGGVDQAAYIADALGMDHAFGANVISGSGQYGTAILSRFKILNTQNYPLPNAPGGEQRGLLRAGVEIGGQEVRVYTTHLQNKMVGLREAQARHVAGIVAQEELPVILGGDMNATANTATLAPLRTQLVDVWESVGSGPEGTGPNGSRIDFLLASPTIKPQRAQALRSAISDHARVYADLVVPASTDCPTGLRVTKGRKPGSGKKG